jgi:hypothetical protein
MTIIFISDSIASADNTSYSSPEPMFDCKDIMSSQLPVSPDGKVTMLVEFCYDMCIAKRVLQFRIQEVQEKREKKKFKRALKEIDPLLNAMLMAAKESFKAFSDPEFENFINVQVPSEESDVLPESTTE